jgi:hypothetical protein
MSPQLTLRLLTAIENNTLVVLCGAGLSIPSPSDLPSAPKVAQICYDRRNPIENLPVALRNNINDLAAHFHARGDFKKVFIPLVPWNELLGQPNHGHAAVADFLVTRAARAALSANFDPLIERWAEQRKVDMRPALTGQEAANFTIDHNPLLKFHGCMHRSRDDTLWTHAQLGEAEIQARITGCANWINLNLPGKDLLVVGFWSDWGYLNDVLAGAFAIENATSVTVVDPSPSAELQAKALMLWTKLNSLSGSFEHVKESGADVLEELRTAHSKAWVRRFYSLGHPLMDADGGVPPAAATPEALSCNDLYALRQDAEGVSYQRAATLKAPAAHAAHSAFAHLLLLGAGAVQRGAWLEHGGRTIRVVNGAGQGLAQVKGRYREPATVMQSEIVVCAGAEDFGVPARVVPLGHGASTVRPAPGGGSHWMTLDQARVELGI